MCLFKIKQKKKNSTWLIVSNWDKCNCRESTNLLWGSTGGSAGKESAYNAGDLGLIQRTWICPLGREDSMEKERLPTPVFWPGEFHGLYSPWGCKESDMTEWLSLHVQLTLLPLFPMLAYVSWFWRPETRK